MLKFITSLFTPNAKASAQSRGLLLGLDGAGKTTLLHKLRGGEVTTSIPTIGFNVETFESRDWGVRSWDVGGCDKMRPLWKHFLDDISFVLFLIDLNDEDRLAEAAEELALFYRMVKNKEHDSSHFFIIFTKEDLLPKPNREKAIANATSRIKTSLQPHLVDTLPLHFLNTPNLNLRTATNLNPALSHIKTLLSPSPPHPPPSFINPSSHPPTPLPPSHTDLLSLIHTHNSTAEPSDAIFWDGFLTAKLPAWDHYAHLRAGGGVYGTFGEAERGGAGEVWEDGTLDDDGVLDGEVGGGEERGERGLVGKETFSGGAGGESGVDGWGVVEGVLFEGGDV
ncbi:hypothetical protein GRF29_28g547332 [Pseudopithomyces chartarum]|uniref:ADP-ribosylation factor n=1 Tax=Pseudopithomyces chartarum TaxID=1892770 RepID=A0AAN6LZE6_9PLEO|nr:hypothetical protein GRF29_28g547332 [Pseudopithomyces chartarum]